MIRLQVLALISAAFISVAQAQDWNYRVNGPETWPSMPGYEGCKGNSQSPINIVPTSAILDLTLNLTLVGEYLSSTPSLFHVKNTGRYIECEAPHGSQHFTAISPSSWGEDKSQHHWHLEQFHFHWGGSDVIGSEHTVSGHRYPMEMHMVHWNSDYGSFDEAKNHEDGLLVMGFFYDTSVTTPDNEPLKSVINSLPSATYRDDELHDVSIDVQSLINEVSSGDFYNYKGSLTTPACYEGVTWVVFQQTIMISREQLDSFRKVAFSEADTTEVKEEMVDNFRSTQPMNQRTLYRSFLAGGQPPPRGWNYRKLGPSVWAAQGYDNCDGSNQSPINIETDNLRGKPELTLDFHGNYKNHPQEFELVNTGTNVEAELHDHSQHFDVDAPGAHSDDVIQTWRLEQFHWHWGGSEVVGSEHTIDKDRFAMEMHMVHWNTKYADFEDAMGYHDGWMVQGFFLQDEAGAPDNQAFVNVTGYLRNILFAGYTVPSGDIDVYSLIEHSVLKKQFYYYKGGLTTPGCNEIVTWYVHKTPIIISTDQLDMFRELHFNTYEDPISEHMVDNFRPTQRLNGRVVYYSEEVTAGVGRTGITVGVVLSILAVATALMH